MPTDLPGPDLSLAPDGSLTAVILGATIRSTQTEPNLARPVSDHGFPGLLWDLDLGKLNDEAAR
jgi:hypothetical protein